MSSNAFWEYDDDDNSYGSEDWEQLWVDMPEYVQGDKTAIKRVVVNFGTEEDIAKFNEVTGLNVTMNTKGVFYPSKIDNKLIYICDEE